MFLGKIYFLPSLFLVLCAAIVHIKAECKNLIVLINKVEQTFTTEKMLPQSASEKIKLQGQTRLLGYPFLEQFRR